MIIIIDDEEQVLKTLTRLIEHYFPDHQVIGSSNIQIALHRLLVHREATLIVDHGLKLPLDGILFIQMAQAGGWRGKAILMSGQGVPTEKIPSNVHFILKPFNGDEISNLINS